LCICYGGSDSPYIEQSSSFKAGSTISLELNTQTNTLHFFIDDTLFPQCITDITTTPLCFGISSYHTSSSSAEVISFLLLKKASLPDNIQCAQYQWGTGKYEKK
jgi:hypothetical protein